MTQPAYADWRATLKSAKDGTPVGAAPTVFKQFGVSVEALDDHCVKFTVTTATPDRERDVLATPGIDTTAYEKNPVVQWAHDYKQLPVGRCVKIERAPDRLVCTVEFASPDLNPFADQVYRMVKAGFLNACSIGFRPLEWTYDEDRGGVNFLKSEMLEFSVCPIPANAEALVAASVAGIDLSVLKDWATQTLRTISDADVKTPRACVRCGVLVDRGELADAAHRETCTAPKGAVAPSADTLRMLHGNEAIVSRAAGKLDDESPLFRGLPWECVAETTQRGDVYRTYDRRASLARWNPQLSKSFDVTEQTFPARSIEQDLAAKYCGCAVKDLYHRFEPVYSTRMGAFLSALDETVAGMTVDDIRNIGSDGREDPPLYEHIQLNSTKSSEFLVDGLRFMQWNGVKIALRVEPRWYGLQVTTYAARKHADAARALFTKTFARAKEFNFLKGEAFSLSGEFLTRGTETFDDIFLDAKNQTLGARLLSLINERGAALENRGVIMLGPPGNGKTLLGRILMNQAKSTFIWASARDFWYSGGFRGLADAFEIARESAGAGTPAILFIEDVDNYLDGQTTDLMKTEMDGIAQSKGVVTILTTNYPELLPKALIDRPGRFHDVVRFDLPNDAARQQMLAKWLPELTGAALKDVVTSLHGYSGAHVREFARFAGIIRSQDGVDIEAAAATALAKLKEQRDLITSVQVQGSRYRAPKHVADGVTRQHVDAATAARFESVATGTFTKDVVGWKAFVKARDRAEKKNGTLDDHQIADMLADYGFDTESVAVRQIALPSSDADVVTKAGRVLSKANETKLANARDVAMNIKSLADAAVSQIDDVLRSAERDDPEPDPVQQASLDEIEFDLGFDEEAVLDAGEAIELSLDDDDSDDAFEIDRDLVTAAVTDGLQDVIAREMQAAINALRGRVD